MAFTKIPGKVGVFRHVATQFVVHEVRNTQQVLDSNGVLVEYNNGDFIWLAGRDLRDFFAFFAVTSLSDIADKLHVTKRGFGSVMIADAKYSSFLRVPMFTDDGYVRRVVNGFPNDTTFATAGFASAKVFGLINNCQAGRGRGGPSAGVAGQQAGYSDDSFARLGFATPARAAMNAAQLHVANGGQTTYNGLYSHTMDRAQLLGTAVVAIPLGMTWEGFVDDVIEKLNPDGRGEITTKCLSSMLPLLPRLKAACPLPMVYAPFELLANGEWRLVQAKAHVRTSRELSVSGEVISRLSSTLRGGCVFNERGHLETACDWVMPAWSDSSSAAFSTFIHTAADNVTQLNAGVTDYSQLNTCATAFSTAIDSIDGIRLERVFGGLSGSHLNDVGEVTPLTNVGMSSADIISSWRGALRFSGTSSVFDTKTDPATSLPETDAARKSRLEGLAATSSVESPFATRLTQWDMHGFSAAHGLLVLCAALDGDATDATWLTPLWPTRLQAGYTLTCAQAGTWGAKADALIATGSPLLAPVA